MRQKYLIIPGKNSLTVKEFSELDKSLFQQVGEVTYDSNTIKVAKEGDVKALIGEIRTPVFYPARSCATKLAETIIEIYQSGESDPVEVAFSDIEQLVRDEVKDAVDDSDTSAAIDALLDDSDGDDIDGDDDLLKDDSIKDLSSTIKIADEDDLIDDDEK